MGEQATLSTTPPAQLVSFDGWLNDLGRTRVTGYRWRKLGLVKTENIFGRHYISREEIAQFERRAMAGEFAQTRATPTDRTPAKKGGRK